MIVISYVPHLWRVKSRKMPETSGPYVVGYRDFTTKINDGESKLDCSIFYPAITPDANTECCDIGLFGVNFLTYG